MSDTLTKIVDDKRKHVAARKGIWSQAECEKRAKAAETLKDGVAKAAHALDSGAARDVLDRLVAITNESLAA